MNRILISSVIVVLVVINAALFSVGNRTGNTALTEISLRLPIPVADTAFAPYYLAIDKGIFAKHGLHVKLEPGSPELNPVKMVSQGIDQFGVVGGPELLFSARAHGAPLVGIALLHKDSNFVVILTRKESGITNVSDLQGEKVGFFYGHISTDILRMLFRKEGVDVQEVDVGFDYGSLLSGKIHAQWAFRTTAGISLPAKGVELLAISPADYGIVTQGHMIITNERMLKEREETVRRFVAALEEALAYSLAHVQEAIEATMKRDPTFKQSVGEEQLKIYNAAMAQNSPLGWISEQAMTQTKEQMIKLGLIPKDFDVKAAYTTAFLQHQK